MSSILQVEGGHPLRGEISVRGAKNFVPKAMVASLLADTPSELYNVPLIRDTDVVSNLLSLHGVRIDFDQDRGTLRMDPSNVKVASRSDIDTLAGASRIPILFCGPLLHQLGEAFIPEEGARSGVVPSTSTSRPCASSARLWTSSPTGSTSSAPLRAFTVPSSSFPSRPWAPPSRRC